MDWDNSSLDVAPTTPRGSKRPDENTDYATAGEGDHMVAAVCEEDTPMIDMTDLTIPGRAYYDIVTGESLTQLKLQSQEIKK